MMKNTTITTIAAALIGASGAMAQTAFSPIVGYTTETINQGFNYIGLTLHEPVAIAGSIDAVASSSGGSTLTENDVDLISVLGASGSTTYILEITSGPLEGTVQEVTSWTASTIETPDDVVASGLGSDVTYQLREASTFASIFGADNSFGLGASDSLNRNEADVIFLPDGNSGFRQFYFNDSSEFTGWIEDGVGPANDQAIFYTDGMYILRRAAEPVSLVNTGSFKDDSTSLALSGSGFNFLSGVYPANSTFGSSGLSSNLQSSDSFDITEADVVFLPDGNSGFRQFYFNDNSTFTGWIEVDAGPANDVELTSGIIVQRRGQSIDLTIQAPIVGSN